jgi:3D (Asp-Asp-Asp) domain-containing protein
LKIKSIFSGSALICTALLSGSLILSASSSSAETLVSRNLQQTTKHSHPVSESSAVSSDTSQKQQSDEVATNATEPEVAVPAAPYIATAYSLRGRTASGKPVSKGLIAADPRVLPLGSRVKLEAGSYSGEYLVADTGGSVRGRRIDIWTPTSREAMRFGRRAIKLTVLSFGGKRRTARLVKK